MTSRDRQLAEQYGGITVAGERRSAFRTCFSSFGGSLARKWASGGPNPATDDRRGGQVDRLALEYSQYRSRCSRLVEHSGLVEHSRSVEGSSNGVKLVPRARRVSGASGVSDLATGRSPEWVRWTNAPSDTRDVGRVGHSSDIHGPSDIRGSLDIRSSLDIRGPLDIRDSSDTRDSSRLRDSRVNSPPSERIPDVSGVSDPVMRRANQCPRSTSLRTFVISIALTASRPSARGSSKFRASTWSRLRLSNRSTYLERRQ